MRLTPLDIKKQEFKKSFRGFDPVEVETFLEMVADEFETLIREKNELTDEVLKLRTQLRDYQNVEKTLKETLMHAQQSINQSKENSERQAELIIREAELKAEKILEDARHKLEKMKNDLVLIKSQKESFARRLKHLLNSQLELISVLEKDDLDFGKYEAKPKRNSLVETPGQAKLEFAGDRESQENTKTVQTSQEDPSIKNAPDLNWKKKSENPAQEGEEPDQAKGPRISDQLII